MKRHLDWKNLKQVVLRENLSKDGIIHIWWEMWLKPLQKLPSATFWLSTTFINAMIWFDFLFLSRIANKVNESLKDTLRNQLLLGQKRPAYLLGLLFYNKNWFSKPCGWRETVHLTYRCTWRAKWVKVVWHILISLLAPQGALIAITTISNPPAAHKFLSLQCALHYALHYELHYALHYAPHYAFCKYSFILQKLRITARNQLCNSCQCCIQSLHLAI